ncbi:DUF4148 domain-containing protein [Paraburkholderia sp.]|uniref:DUF4148 domain-containing protein n=1 Tax=Paraburkholderia sp. TaxID=1926495 RepID=UPI0023994D34|nr:DUF4148 domain-containing protein [Paraburkholderia sp.]MDE1180033.1 hypothetical protein [Paraburkholderia sp.]
MKSTIHLVVASVVLSVPLLASAQQADMQRSHVRNELLSLEQAGYSPSYPASLTAAEVRLSGGAGADQSAGGYGMSVHGSTQAGRATNVNTAQSIYFGL